MSIRAISIRQAPPPHPDSSAMTVEEQLAAILAKLEEMNALWHSPAESQTASLPSSASLPRAIAADDHGVDIGTNSKPATPISASSTSSASPPPTSPGTTSGVAPVTTDGHEVIVSTNGKLPTTSPAALVCSSTSTLPHDPVLATASPPYGVPASRAATMSALVVSTDQDGSGMLATSPMALTSASSTSSTETSNANSILILKQPQAAPTKCLMSGLYHIACAPELAATTLPPPTVSPVSAPPQDTHAGMLIGASLQFLSIGVCKSQIEFEGNFSCNLVIDGSIRSEQCCMQQKPPWLLFSEIPIFWLGLQQPWPPPILVELLGCNSDVRPAPWPSLDCCSIEAQMISTWPPPMVFKTLGVSLTTACIVEEFSDPIGVFACCHISMNSWPPLEPSWLMLPLSFSCVSPWLITGCATIYFCLEICVCRKHWLKLLEGVAQVCVHNWRGAVNLFPSNKRAIFCDYEICKLSSEFRDYSDGQAKYILIHDVARGVPKYLFVHIAFLDKRCSAYYFCSHNYYSMLLHQAFAMVMSDHAPDHAYMIHWNFSERILHQIWVFTDILDVAIVILLDGAFSLIQYLRSKNQIDFTRPPCEAECQLYLARHLVADISNITFWQCYRQLKPPWLLCTTDLSVPWFEKMKMSSGFLLEVPPWCREYVLSVQLKTPWPPPAIYNLMHRKKEFWPRIFFLFQCNHLVMLVQRKTPWLLPCWVCGSFLESFRLFLIRQNEVRLSIQSPQLHYSNSGDSLHAEFVERLPDLQVFAADFYIQMMKIIVSINISRYYRTYMLLVVYAKLVQFYWSLHEQSIHEGWLLSTQITSWSSLSCRDAH